jgi:D-xylose transport system permease protein
MTNIQKSASSPTQSGNLFSRLQLDGRLIFMVLTIAAMWIIFSFLTDGTFMSIQNLWKLSVQTSSVGVMVSAMVLIIVMRHVDLSIGSILGFTGMIMAVLNARVFPHDAPWNAWATLAAGLLVGGLIGAIQGAWVAYLSVPAFIVTLGGLMIYRGGAWLVTDGQTVGSLTDGFKVLGGGLGGSIGAIPTWIVGAILLAYVFITDISNYLKRQRNNLPNRPIIVQVVVTGLSVLLILGFIQIMNGYKEPFTDISQGMPVPVLIMLMTSTFMIWVVRSTQFGRYVFAYGGNPEAARLAGINTKMLTTVVFAIMGVFAGLAGAIQTARLESGTNSTGTLSELLVIAGAVIGGTSLAGGTGSIPGAFLGALLMSSLISGLVLMGFNSSWQQVAQGLVLMIAVLLDVLYNRNRPR